MERDYKDYLKDIVEAIEKTQSFTSNIDYDSFIKDDKTIFAVIRALEVVGEALKGVSEDIRKLNPDIPWKDMAGMRDVLIHDYFGVDYETVWLTVKEKIPEILPLIKNLLKEMGDEET